MKKVLLIFFLFSLLCFGNNSIENNNAENTHIEKLKEAVKNKDADLARNLMSEFYDKFPKSDKLALVRNIYGEHLDDLRKELAELEEAKKKNWEEIKQFYTEYGLNVEVNETTRRKIVTSDSLLDDAPIELTFLFWGKNNMAFALTLNCYSDEPVLFDKISIVVDNYVYATNIESDKINTVVNEKSKKSKDKFKSSLIIGVSNKEHELFEKLKNYKSGKLTFYSNKKNIEVTIRESDIHNINKVLNIFE